MLGPSFPVPRHTKHRFVNGSTSRAYMECALPIATIASDAPGFRFWPHLLCQCMYMAMAMDGYGSIPNRYKYIDIYGIGMYIYIYICIYLFMAMDQYLIDTFSSEMNIHKSQLWTDVNSRAV